MSSSSSASIISFSLAPARVARVITAETLLLFEILKLLFIKLTDPSEATSNGETWLLVATERFNE